MSEIGRKFGEIEARGGKGPHAREEKLELLAYILDYIYRPEGLEGIIKAFEKEKRNE